MSMPTTGTGLIISGVTYDYSVSGAGTAYVDGGYNTYSGLNYITFRKADGGTDAYLFLSAPEGGYWYLGPDEIDINAVYYVVDAVGTPPASGWATIGAGSAPAPTVAPG